MRAQFSRVTSARLLMVLLGSAALSPLVPVASVRAQEAPVLDGSGAPLMLMGARGFDRMAAVADPIIPLADLPAPVLIADDRDVTGSIGAAGPDAGLRPIDPAAVPPVLPFDDQTVAAPTAAPELSVSPPPPIVPAAAAPAAAPPPASPAAPAPAAPMPAAPAPVPEQASLQAPPALDAAPPAPAAVPPLDAKTMTPSPAPAAETTAPQGLAAADLGQALAQFGTEPFATPETAAQASERRKTREAIVAFYAARANQPLWIVDGHLTPAARSLLGRLDHASEDGLDLRGFAVALPRNADTTALARAELALSEAVVAYGRQAGGSRVDVAKLGGIIDLRPEVVDAARILGTLMAAPDAGEALHAFNPPEPGYAALRDKLAELRQRSVPEAQNRIPPGPVLKRGMRDARVPLVRARFGLDVTPGDAAPALVYDTKVAAAVADFQRANGLPASGTLTPRTIAVLSGGNPTRLENAIVANMEFWRWLPRDLGPDRVEVNIPDYAVRVIRDGAVADRARVVVGKPDKPTPVFAQQMKFIIVNPYWNVPLSIINKEMMPKLAEDPNYFQDHGYEVIERNGTTFVRQPPGDDNALGRIKFMFPNQHSVYLHDTNARSFFGRDKRALSHGCVRVDQPFRFAEAVMGPGSGWTEARVKSLIGGKERTINLPKPLPIYIEYFTAFVDPQTGFQLRDDVYGYENRVKLALGLQD